MTKIYSWNVNGIRAVYNKGLWDNFLNLNDPDIICLQEIKAKPEQINFMTNKYSIIWNSAEKPGYSGTAILSRIQPISIRKNFEDFLDYQTYNLKDKYGDPTNEGRVTTAEFNDYFVVSVYTPNAKNDLSRLNLRHSNWDPVFLNYINYLEKTKPVIVTGDFNTAHQEIDLANPKANKGKKGFTDQERAGFDKLIASGLIDSFRYFNKEPGHYTWWSHFANARKRNIGWRIDYILVSKSLITDLISSSIHADILGSDHCPISIVIKN